MGRGAVGGGGGTPDGRPTGNGGGRPGSSPSKLSTLSPDLRGGNEEGEGNRGGSVSTEVSAGLIDSGAGWIGGTGRLVNGRGAAKGGDPGGFGDSASEPSSGTPWSKPSSFSSDFQSSEGKKNRLRSIRYPYTRKI